MNIPRARARVRCYLVHSVTSLSYLLLLPVLGSAFNQINARQEKDKYDE